jgi:hypothetical protein
MISLSVIVIGLISYLWRQTFQEKTGFPKRDLSPLDAPVDGLKPVTLPVQGE